MAWLPPAASRAEARSFKQRPPESLTCYTISGLPLPPAAVRVDSHPRDKQEALRHHALGRDKWRLWRERVWNGLRNRHDGWFSDFEQLRLEHNRKRSS